MILDEHVCATSILEMMVCVRYHLAARLIRLGVWKGVGHRTSPFRLKNHACGYLEGAASMALAHERSLKLFVGFSGEDLFDYIDAL